jgi:hypothetical protein
VCSTFMSAAIARVLSTLEVLSRVDKIVASIAFLASSLDPAAALALAAGAGLASLPLAGLSAFGFLAHLFAFSSFFVAAAGGWEGGVGWGEGRRGQRGS